MTIYLTRSYKDQTVKGELKMTRAKQHGNYYHSLREWLNAGDSIDILKAPMDFF